VHKHATYLGKENGKLRTSACKLAVPSSLTAFVPLH
jgi:hypothetical protein